MNALAKFIQKSAGRSGGRQASGLEELLMKLGAEIGTSKPKLGNIGRSGGRQVGGFEAATGLEPKKAALIGGLGLGGAGAAGYGLSEALEEEDDNPIKKLLAAIGLE